MFEVNLNVILERTKIIKNDVSINKGEVEVEIR